MRIFLAATIFLSCIAPIPTSGQTGEVESRPSATSIATYPANFSFAFDLLQTSYRFENDGTGRKDVTAKIHILTKSGSWQWSELRFDYKPSSERLEIPYIRIVKRDGSVVNVANGGEEDRRVPQEIRELNYDEKRAHVPGLFPGDVLEYEVVTIIQRPVAPGQFWVQHKFQSNWVVNERLEIDVPNSRAVKLTTQPGIHTWATKESPRTVYNWELLNLSLKDHRAASDPIHETADVQLSSFASWEEVGKWYAEMEKRPSVPTSAIRAKADELTKSLHGDLEKAEAIYEFVAKKIEYLSLVSFGIGGYEPTSAGEVLRRGTGDCKDKIALMTALLEIEGIHASPVLTSPIRDVDPDVPSPWPFTHVIAVFSIGTDKIWTDPSSSTLPFRMLPYQLGGRQGLITPTKGVAHFETLPSDLPTPSLQPSGRDPRPESVSQRGQRGHSE